MLELLQNADDCDFAEGVTPSLTVTFEPPTERVSNLAALVIWALGSRAPTGGIPMLSFSSAVVMMQFVARPFSFCLPMLDGLAGFYQAETRLDKRFDNVGPITNLTVCLVVS